VIELGPNLSYKKIASIVLDGESVIIDKSARKKVEDCYIFLETFSKKKIIYGINTGFGPMAQFRVADEQLRELQYNIIRSHSCGAGELLPCIYVRSAMLARLSNFLMGKSGVNIELCNLLVAFLNNQIYPVIPEHGGVGASGDLVQMAHIGLALIGEGEVVYKEERRETREVLKECGLKPLEIYIREGLAIANGTSVMAGIAAVNIHYSQKLIKWSTLASVIMNEIASSYDDFVSEPLMESRSHKGQLHIATQMREMFATSSRLKKRESDLYNGTNNTRVFKEKVQGYYSLRCVPQILGPVYDTLINAMDVVEKEFNSVCDNPVVDPDTQNIYHGGNFHGDYISFEMDKLKIAITKLTMLTERQLNYLFHDKINGILPPFVNLGVPGLNYGLQAAQFTATSTTAESQTLSNPVYVHSIPNNNDNQDIVSMGTNSALMAAKVIENGYQVMAIHYMALLQAIDYLDIVNELSKESREIYFAIRDFFPKFTDDTPKYKEIEAIVNFLKNREN
jgi:histidine ammonia-lyase